MSPKYSDAELKVKAQIAALQNRLNKIENAKKEKEKKREQAFYFSIGEVITKSLKEEKIKGDFLKNLCNEILPTGRKLDLTISYIDELLEPEKQTPPEAKQAEILQMKPSEAESKNISQPEDKKQADL